ncbi:MAG: MarR family winged helix-turn-helix transcriptional regulator [Pseudohaliea sp.]
MAELKREDSFGWLIAVLSRQLSDEFDQRLQALGLRIGLWPTLFALWEEDGVTQSVLTEKCQTAHYTTTRVLDELEKRGLVERRPHPTNRRATTVFLTKEGKALEHPAVAEAKACNARMLAGLSRQENDRLMTMLRKIAGLGSR